MALLWQSQQFRIVGNQDRSVAPCLKAWVQQGNVTVCGIIGEGSTLTLGSGWDSPFEDASLDSQFKKTAGIIQLDTNVALKSNANFAQVWSGDRPASVSLNLHFIAINDAQTEVEDALTALKEFKSPQLNAVNPIAFSSDIKEWSQAPSPVSVSIGRYFIFPDMLITEYSEPLDVLTDANGYRVQAMIPLQLESRSTLNRSDMRSIRG